MTIDVSVNPSSPDHDANEILNDAWQEAARINPMLLASLRASYDFTSLREVISDCLEKGFSVSQIRKHIVGELLGSATRRDQPHTGCEQRTSG
jgi:hypothetical protein